MKRRFGYLLPALLAIIGLSSCVSVNHLDAYDFDGSAMAPSVYAPPYADVSLARGEIPGSDENDFLMLVQIGADIAVGVEEQELERRISHLLQGEDITIALKTEFVPEVAGLLHAMTTEYAGQADYLLQIDVAEYGLSSSDGGGGIYLHMIVDARIVYQRDGETVWRRRLNVEAPASPSFFGVNEYIGTAININIMKNLSDDALREGFRLLSEEAAFRLSEKFRRDYYKSRPR